LRGRDGGGTDAAAAVILPLSPAPPPQGGREGSAFIPAPPRAITLAAMLHESRYPLQTIEAARTLYREGTRVRDIAAATGMSVGALYYHFDGHALPGLVPPRLPRRREVERAALPGPSRGRQRLAARLLRAAERQARKIERSLAWDFQRKEDRALDLAALRELTRILRDLSVLEDSSARGGQKERRERSVEHEQALAVEGRAVVISRTREG
jgi:AcrR family transcriptional regulator